MVASSPHAYRVPTKTRAAVDPDGKSVEAALAVLMAVAYRPMSRYTPPRDWNAATSASRSENKRAHAPDICYVPLVSAAEARDRPILSDSTDVRPLQKSAKTPWFRGGTIVEHIPELGGPVWSVHGTYRSQPVVIGGKWGRLDERLEHAKTVAVGCQRLPRKCHGKGHPL